MRNRKIIKDLLVIEGELLKVVLITPITPITDHGPFTGNSVDRKKKKNLISAPRHYTPGSITESSYKER